MANTVFRTFNEKLSSETVFQYIGDKGDIFWDIDVPILYMSDGSTLGGIPLTGGGGGGPTSAALVNLIPTGNVASTNLQAAIGEIDAEKVNKAGDTMTGPLTLPVGTPTANLHAATKQYVDTVAGALTIDALLDANTAGALNGQVLQFNGIEWKAANLTTVTDTYVNSASFSTGTLQLTRNDGNNVTVNLDGRYLRSINGIFGDSVGNAAVSLVGTKTGTLASRPLLDVDGTIFIVSGDANTALNGTSYIYSTAGGQWYQLVNSDTAANDARYVNVSGDTMTGNLVLSGAPSANLHAATKLYVDQTANSSFWTNYPVAIANTSIDALNDVVTTGVVTGNYLRWNGTSWVPGNVVTTDTFVSNTSYTVANGAFTITLNNGNTFTQNLKTSLNDHTDVSVAGANTGEILTFNGVNWVPGPGPAADIYVTNTTFTSANGNLRIGQSNSFYVSTNIDGRYVLLAGDTMTGNLVLAGAPTANLHAATKLYVDELVANSEIYTSNATFDANTLVLTQTRSNSTTYSANLQHSIGSHTDVSVAGAVSGQFLRFNGGNWAPGNTIDTYTQSTSFNNSTLVLTHTRNDSSIYQSNLAHSIGSHSDANTSGVVSGQYLKFDGTNWVPGNVVTVDTFTNTAVFTSSNSTIIFTRNDSTTYSANLAHTLGSHTDVSVAGANTGQILQWNGTNWIPANNTGIYVTNNQFTSANGLHTITLSNSAIVTTNIDGRYVLLAGDTMTGNLVLAGAPTSNLHAATKLYVDQLVANSEVYVTNGSFDSTTGEITLTRNDSNTIIFDIDGRYAQKVNAIAPDANGNIAISLTQTQTGPFASRPASANAGVIYVVSGDANTSLNGKTYIYETTTPSWQEVVSFDTASADARYVNVSGDTMAGDLTLNANPTANLHAATKQYVDVQLAAMTVDGLADANTSGVVSGQYLKFDGTNWIPGNVVTVDTFTSNAVLSNTTLTFTRNDSTTYSANIAHNISNHLDVDVTGLANTNVLKWDTITSKWKPRAGGVTVSDTAPAGPINGDLWYDSLNLELYIYYSDGTNAAWVSATGTTTGLTTDWVQSTITVGATGTAPTKPATVIQDYVRYRNTGFKNYEVEYKYAHNAVGGGGSGDYLFSLPAGLQFNTTIHPINNTATPTATVAVGGPFVAASLPNGIASFIAYGINEGSMFIVPYSATQFRLWCYIDVSPTRILIGNGTNAGYGFNVIPLTYNVAFKFTAA